MTLPIKRFFLICTSLLVLFVCSCKLPVDPQKRDLVEFERVWQYCKAFSLYTERVPAHDRVFEFDSVHFIMDSLYDTLYIWWKGSSVPIAYYDYNSLNGDYFNRYNFDIDKQSAETVNYQKLTDSTGYLSITEFVSSTDNEVGAYDNEVRNIPNIIIDLRKNDGGYVNSCDTIIQFFLPTDTPYLDVTYRKCKKTSLNGPDDTGTVKNEIWKSIVSNSAWEGKKVVIFIDSSTASAAELLTVGIKDGLGENAYIIGSKSLGKSIGQYLFRLRNGASLLLTAMRFFPIKSIDYHEKGIMPDKVFTGTFEEQLQEAINWLESDYKNKIDTEAYCKILSKNNERKKPRFIGCVQVFEYEDLSVY